MSRDLLLYARTLLRCLRTRAAMPWGENDVLVRVIVATQREIIDARLHFCALFVWWYINACLPATARRARGPTHLVATV